MEPPLGTKEFIPFPHAQGRPRLWYRRVDWTQVLVTTTIAAIFVALTIYTTKPDSQQDGSEPAEESRPAVDVTTITYFFFSVMAFVVFTASRMIHIGARNLCRVAPPHSAISRVLRESFWAELVSPVALGLYSVALLHTLISYIDGPDVACGPERDMMWHLSIGDQGHRSQGMGIWLVHVLISAIISGVVCQILWWPGLRSSWCWMGLCGASILIFGTAALVARPCVARPALWSVLHFTLLASAAVWAFSSRKLLFSPRLDDAHFEVLWYGLAIYAVARAPVVNYCQVEGC